MATQPLRSTRKPAKLEAGESAPAPSAKPLRRLHALAMRIFTRRDGRAPVWLEAIVVVWLLWLYDQINNLAPLRRIVALHNAASVLAFERSLNISPELGLDRWVADHATIGIVLSYYYVSAHFFVTFGLLAWLWWRKSKAYYPLRTQLVIINLIGLAIFWLFPVAPPRMLHWDGFRDVIAITAAIGDFHQGALASTADQYAAMPSLHIAWASWCCVVVWRMFRTRSRAGLALAYPFVDRVRRHRDRQPLPARRPRRSDGYVLRRHDRARSGSLDPGLPTPALRLRLAGEVARRRRPRGQRCGRAATRRLSIARAASVSAGRAPPPRRIAR